MIRPGDLPAFYRHQLLENIVPFWLRHSRDQECGGYFTCLDRDGSVYDPGKPCLWGQGRIAWAFAWLYNELEQVPEWIDFARLGVDFLLKHGFAPSGRMYYATLQDGTPQAAGQDYHVELSAVLAFSEVGHAIGSEALCRKARSLFDRTWNSIRSPDADWNSALPESRRIRTHDYSMITLNVLQLLRTRGEESNDNERIQTCIQTIMRYHLKPEQRVLLEVVSENGSPLPGSAGRLVNPGHMIEAGIFIIHEARRCGDKALKSRGLDLIQWGFERGWDHEEGGIFTEIDSEGKPMYGASLYRSTCKLWWQHAEALYGLLLAYVESGENWFLQSYDKVHDYSFTHFADPEFGEWYSTLDRRGQPISRAKGSNRKNCFHIIRNFFWCSRLDVRSRIEVERIGYKAVGPL